MAVAFDIQFAHQETIDELIHKEWYTVAEICELFRFSPLVVRRAARQGRLRAIIIDHHVYGARREDLIAWLREQAAR